MSTLKPGTASGPDVDALDRSQPPLPSRIASWTLRMASENSLLVVCTSVFAVALLLRLSIQVNQDAWLGIAGGRQVVDLGLPHHEAWTLWGAGKPVVDQQWFAQAVLFSLFMTGGWALTAAVHAAMITGAVCLAVIAARRGGASQRSVLVMLPLPFFLVIEGTWQLRTQSLVYPLFVLCLWLAIEDSRRPSPRVFLCLPLLALWANLHGSVVFGAGLVAIRGLTRALSSWREGGRSTRMLAPGLGLALLAPAMLFVSPYGASLAGYYHHTLLNPDFSSMVTEWEPPQFGPLMVPLFAVMLGAMWLLGRARRSFTGFERIVLVITALGALDAVRNVSWFGLTAIVLLPLAVEETWPGRVQVRPRLASVNAVVAAATLVAVIALFGVTLHRPDSWFTELYPTAGADRIAAAAAAHPKARIFADVKYADWLLFERPELAGRIAYDARFELLSVRRIRQLFQLDGEYGNPWRAPTQGFRLLVFNRLLNANAIRGALREPGAHLIYSAHGMAVIERSA